MPLNFNSTNTKEIKTNYGIIEISIYDNKISLPRFKMVRKDNNGVFRKLGMISFNEAREIGKILKELTRNEDIV